MLLAFCMGSQMAVLMSEQPGLDGSVDGNSDSDENSVQFGLWVHFNCKKGLYCNQKSPELPPDPDIICHCEPALCCSRMPRCPLLCRRGCSLLSDPSHKVFAFLSVVTQGL